MRKNFKLIIILIMLLSPTSTVLADDGTWSAAASGNWSDAGNWSSGTIGDGDGATAFFTDSVRYDVTVDSARTIGNITSTGTNRHDFNGADSLILAGSPTIEVGDIDGDDFVHCAIWNPLDGTEGFTKTGEGILGLVHWSITNSISGTITVEKGILKSYDSLEGFMPNISSVIVSNGAQLRLENGNPYCLNPLVLSGSGIAAHNGNFCGALFVNTPNQTTIISNTISVLTNDTRIGGYCGGELNKYKFIGEITGPGQVNFYAGGGLPTHKWTFELYNQNNYSGGARVSADFGAAATLKLCDPNALAHSLIEVNASWNYDAPATLDLNGYTNIVTRFEMNGTQKEVVTDTSANGNGLLIVDGGGENNMLWRGDFYLYGGKVQHTNTYCTIRAGTDTIITGGVLSCNLETMIARAAAGDCSMTVRDSGTLNTFMFRFNDWGNATVNLITGGVIKTSTIWHLAESGAGPYTQTFNFNGGTLSDAGWPLYGAGFIRNDGIDYIVQAGGARIDIDGYNGTKVVANVLQHDSSLGGTLDGGLTKLGAGALVLSTNNSYTGPTVVSEGSLIIDGEITSSSSITVEPGAVIGGSGSVNGFTLTSGGIIAPGNSAGTLNINSDFTMNAGALYNWEVGTGQTSDLINISGALIVPASANSITVNISRIGEVLPTDENILFTTTGGAVDVNSIYLNYSGLTGPVHPTSSGNNIVVIGVTPLPDSPTDVSATDGTYTDRVKISWDLIIDAEKYAVYRTTSAVTNLAINISGDIPGASNEYFDTTCLNNSNYYYWVIAGNSYGWSEFGDYDSGFCSASNPPDKPVNQSPADDSLQNFPVSLMASAYSDAAGWPFTDSKWQLSTEVAFSSPIEFQKGPTNIVEVSSSLIFTGTNFWRVSYKSDRNKWSDWSDATSFIINRDVNSPFYFYDSFNNVAGSGNANLGYYNSGRQFGSAAPLDYSISGTTEVGQSAAAPNQLTLTGVASVSPNYSFTDYTNFVIEFDVFPANSSWTAISFGKNAQNAFPISIGGIGIVFFGAGASAEGAYQVFSSETLIGNFAGAPNSTNMRVKIAVTTDAFDYDNAYISMFINGKPMPLKQDSFIDPNPTNNHPIYFYTLEKGNGFGENFITLYNNGDMGTIDNFKISPCGAKLSTRIWENDDNMWIGSSNDIAEFTHAVNLNWDSEITVDGLPFEALGEIGVLQTNDSIPQVNGSDWSVFGADGNISAGQFEFQSAPLPSGSGADIAKYFFYGWGSSIGITLSNLTAGSSNIFYIYGRPFANTSSRQSYISGSDGGIFLVDENDQPDKCQIISYEYLANSDGTFSITFTPLPNQDYILYGFSSAETGIPEPGLFIIFYLLFIIRKFYLKN